MPEPLLSDDPLVGEWDPVARMFTVTGWVAGPAGIAGVDVPGAELDVDVADPSRTCQLLVDAAPGDDPAALSLPARSAVVRLLGVVRTDALLGVAGAGGGGDRGRTGGPRQLPHLGTAGGRRRDRIPDEPGLELAAVHHLTAARGGRDGGVALRLSRLALARLTAGGDDAPATARAVARLEAAVLGTDLPADLGLAAAVAADSRTGAGDLLALAAAGELGPVDTRTAPELAALLRTAAHLPGTESGTVFALTRLAAQLATEAIGSGSAAGGRALRAAFSDAAHLAAVPDESPATGRPHLAPAPPPEGPTLDEASLRRLLPPGVQAVISLRRECEIEVAFPREAVSTDGLWARAFRPADGLLVALAPFQPAGDGGRCRLLVPPANGSTLVVDLTRDPAAPATSTALGAVERALSAGRRAARAQRLGDSAGAARLWRECGVSWHAAGDLRRATMAAEYAKQVRVTAGSSRATLVSDHLW